MLNSQDENNSGFYTSMLNNEDDSLEHTLFGTSSNDLLEQSEQAKSKSKSRTGGYSTDEDLLLISAYLHVSTNAITGTQQKQEAFWSRVHAQFISENKYVRSQASLTSRWSVINRMVSKFVGCYAQVQQMQESGLTETDRILRAKKLFEKTVKKTWNLDHCWNALKNELRWTSASSSPTTHESIKLEDDNDTGGNDFERSMGRKATKELVKKKKRKETIPDKPSAAVLVLEEYRKNYVELENEKKERIVRTLQYQEEYIQLEKKKREDLIMMTDTSGMDEVRAAYFKKLQMDILNNLK